MIKSHNIKQVVMAVFLLLGSILSYLVAYWFFRYVVYSLSKSFGYQLSETAASLSVYGILFLVTLSGFFHWKNKGDFYSYHESGLFENLDEISAGAYEVNLRVHRITTPAYILGQIFLAGPLYILKAIQRIQNRITVEGDLEVRVQSALAVLQKQNKWQSINDHASIQYEICLLVQMKQIDFSTQKGELRIKAYPPHGI